MHVRTRIALVPFALLPVPLQAQTLERDFTGPLAARFGEALGPLEDLDGDGLGEALVGAPGEDLVPGSDVGTVRVYRGPSLADYARGVVAQPDVLLVLEGESAGDEFGCAVWGTGTADYDGDGVPELLVGARGFDGAAGVDCGAVYVVSGTWLRQRAQGLPAAPSGVLLRIEGSLAGDRFGHVVDGSGDGDADGWRDVAVGAPEHAGVGLVEVLSGAWIQAVIAGTSPLPPRSLLVDSTGTTIAPEVAHHGWSLAWLGDFDQDGDDDLVIGAPSDSTYRTWSGAARVLSGGDFHQITQVPGGLAAIPNNVGISVAGPGDLGTDGVPEILVGAPWETPNASPCGTCCNFSGLVFLFRGPLAWPPSTWDSPYGVQTSGTAATCFSAHLGVSVAGCGDFDGDGLREAVLGQPDSNDPTSGCGVVAVLGDADVVSRQLVFKTAGKPGDHLGTKVAPAGDLNGDGYADFLAQAQGGAFVRVVLGRPAVCAVVTSDCNGNGSDDACDLALGLSADCNDNGIPDECDPLALTGLDPAVGAVGDVVRVLGEGFVADATLVLFGSRLATEVTFVSTNELRVRVPPQTGTTSGHLGQPRIRVSVSVATCIGAATRLGAFSYQPVPR